MRVREVPACPVLERGTLLTRRATLGVATSNCPPSRQLRRRGSPAMPEIGRAAGPGSPVRDEEGSVGAAASAGRRGDDYQDDACGDSDVSADVMVIVPVGGVTGEK